jgi:pyoverdine/dityrosine biosynthesis protein Dit1
MDLFEMIYQLGTKAMVVPDFRVFTDPHTVVDHSADVLGKLPLEER